MMMAMMTIMMCSTVVLAANSISRMTMVNTASIVIVISGSIGIISLTSSLAHCRYLCCCERGSVCNCRFEGKS